MQLAALLIETAADRLDEDTTGTIVHTRRDRGRQTAARRPAPRATRGRD
jgi:hypothetical protein